MRRKTNKTSQKKMIPSVITSYFPPKKNEENIQCYLEINVFQIERYIIQFVQKKTSNYIAMSFIRVRQGLCNSSLRSSLLANDKQFLASKMVGFERCLNSI